MTCKTKTPTTVISVLIASLALISSPVSLAFQQDQQIQWMQQGAQLAQQAAPTGPAAPQTDQFGNLLIASPQHQQQQIQQTRPPIAAELQNQVNALSAQLAAANRQLSLFQQQLRLVTNPQEQPQQMQQPSAPVNEPLIQQQQPIQQHQNLAGIVAQQQQQQPQSNLFSLQQQLSQLQQQQQQQQQQHQQQFFNPGQQAGQPVFGNQREAERPTTNQESPIVSTLINGNELEDQSRFSANLDAISQQQQQQQQANAASQHQQQLQQHQQAEADLQRQQQPVALNTTPANPTVSSIERPQQQVRGPVQQQQQQQPQPQQAPSIDQAPPHNPPRNDDKFAIGLGVLSPGYTQKFGNTALDFNQDKNGFSFTLNNNGHSNQPQTPAPRPGQ